MSRIKNWYSNVSDPVRAALRTFKQTIVGGVIASVLMLTTTALDVLNNRPVDVYEDLSTASKALGIVFVGAVVSLVTFADNKWGRGQGAQYNVPDPNTPPE